MQAGKCILLTTIMKPAFIILVFLVSFICLPANALELPPEKEAQPIWTDSIGWYSVNIACSGDAEFCVAGADTGILKMYDRTGKVLWSYTDHRSNRAVAISGDGSLIAAAFVDSNAPSGTGQNEVILFHRNSSIIGRYETPLIVYRLQVPDNGDLIIASAGVNILVLDDHGNLITKYPLSGAPLNIAITGDGRLGVAAIDNGPSIRDGTITLISPKNGTAWEFRTENRARAVAMTHDAGSVIAADEYMLYSLDAAGVLRWKYPSNPRFQDVAQSDDGEIIAAVSQYYLRVFNRNGTLLWKYEERGYISDVSMSASGDWIIAGLPEGKTTLFDRDGNVIWWYNQTALVTDMSRSGDYYMTGTEKGVAFFNRWGNTTLIPSGNNHAENPDNAQLAAPLTERTFPPVSQTPESSSYFMPVCTILAFFVNAIIAGKRWL